MTTGVSPLISVREQVIRKMQEYEEASSYGKMQIIIQLRTIFQHAQIPDAKDAIDAMTVDRELHILLGVGMRGELYYYLAKRRAEVLGV